MAISAREIVYSVGMSGRPEFYSGRGALFEDLPIDKLVRIHTIIGENFGADAAKAFVTMMENLKSLSATNFLNALYALEANNWVYYPVHESDIDVGHDGPQRAAVAFATIFSSLSSNRDDTEYIRMRFLSKIR